MRKKRFFRQRSQKNARRTWPAETIQIHRWASCTRRGDGGARGGHARTGRDRKIGQIPIRFVGIDDFIIKVWMQVIYGIIVGWPDSLVWNDFWIP